MLPKRIVFFLLAVTAIISWTLLAPSMERAAKESRSVDASPSVSPYGFKALYLLMSRLQDQPVDFWAHSMMRLPLDEPKTIWFIEPGAGLFHEGDIYSRQMRELVDNGYHFVFVLGANSLNHFQQGKTIEVVEELNRWYGLSLQMANLEMDEEGEELDVQSHFPTRRVATLRYEKPRVKKAKQSQMLMDDRKQVLRKPKLLWLEPGSLGNARVLLTADEQETPLAVTYSRGKGAITVLTTSLFFKNGQLDKADNAALAVAVQEMFPNQPILFEIYSSGFKENPDVITYLATGKGVVFLICMLLLLVAFCLWLANQPIRRYRQLKTSDERYFTQEAFIDALSKHYLGTGRWLDLYKKLLAGFKTELEQRWPNYTEEEQLQVIAQSPFIDVSLKELESVFVLKNITTEEAFVRKSQQLLEVQRKVCHYDHNKSSARTVPATTGSR